MIPKKVLQEISRGLRLALNKYAEDCETSDHFEAQLIINRGWDACRLMDVHLALSSGLFSTKEEDSELINSFNQAGKEEIKGIRRSWKEIPDTDNIDLMIQELKKRRNDPKIAHYFKAFPEQVKIFDALIRSAIKINIRVSKN